MAIWDIKERNKVVRAFDSRPTRALEMGGYDPALTANGTFMNMDSQATSVDFGDLIDPRTLFGGMTSSNTTRALFHSAEEPGSNPTDIDSITMASQGNASDHGDLTIGKGYGAATSNGIWAISAGGNTVIDVIDYGTIAATGNFADFGDLTVARNALIGICSPIRGVFAGGSDGSSPTPATKNTIDYITINSAGDATDFGDLTGTAAYMGVACNATRGFFMGSHTAISTKDGDGMEYITFASTGNGTDFGDLLVASRAGANACNGKHGFMLGGHLAPAASNTVQKFNMSSLGDMVDFSDLSRTLSDNKGATGAHDGIDWDSISLQRPSVTHMPGSGRGLFCGGHNPTLTSVIEMCHIPTLGNTSDFGDMVAASRSSGGMSSVTRGVFSGIRTPSNTNQIECIEFASLGNAADFGNAEDTTVDRASCSSTTRGVLAGGYDADDNLKDVIEYITIATAGNATDFGDLTDARESVGGCGSSTRGIFAGGNDPSISNIVDYITIASTADAADFGDLSATRAMASGLSSSVRGIFGGGIAPSVVNIMDYFTIASTGDATDFGDLTATRRLSITGSNNTRGVFAGGYGGSPAAFQKSIDYITIASTGDAADFGDLTAIKEGGAGCSDSHGGLQA